MTSFDHTPKGATILRKLVSREGLPMDQPHDKAFTAFLGDLTSDSPGHDEIAARDQESADLDEHETNPGAAV